MANKCLVAIIIILVLSLFITSCTGSTSTGDLPANPITSTTDSIPAANFPNPPVTPVTTETTPSQSLKDYLQTILQNNKLPALSAVVISGGKIIDQGVVGIRKVGDPAPVTIDDQFLIGSCTKAFTSTLIAILVDKGQLKWTTTLSEIYPEMAGEMIPKYRDVTLLELLSHHSGLPAGGGYDPPSTEINEPITQRRYEYIKYFLCHYPKADSLPEPGTIFIYSNPGYNIAGAIAEQVTGKPWEELIQTLIFQPLGITTGGFGASATGNQIDQPWQHRFDNGVYIPVPAEEVIPYACERPCGSIHLSLKDWARFITMHLEGEKGGATLLRADTFKVLHTPPFAADNISGWFGSSKYALGWMVSNDFITNKPVIAHDGSNGVNYAMVWMSLEHDLAILVATNAGSPGRGGNSEVGQICAEVIYFLINKYFPL